MYIVISGAGRVGRGIASRLVDEGHDVALIDRNRERLTSVMNEMDVIGYCGNSANLQTLREADAGTSNVFIAATDADEVNLISCMLARQMGADFTVARLRNPEYTESMDDLRRLTGISMILNPDYIAAEEISRVLQFPNASQVEIFPDSSFELVTARISDESRLHGLSLKELERKFNSKVLICAVSRQETVCIPKGDFVLRKGDLIAVTGTTHHLRRFFVAAGDYKKPVRNVIVLGGSRIAVCLTQILENTGVDVTIIEQDRKHSEYLAEQLQTSEIICADGTDPDVLEEAGLSTANAFIALTGNDEDNIILGMYARKAGTDKVLAEVNDPRLPELLGESFQDMGLSPKEVMAEKIAVVVRSVRGPEKGSNVESLFMMSNGRILAVEFVAGPEARCIGRPLKDLRLRRDMLVAGIIHAGKSIIPDGRTVIRAEDSVIVVTTDREIRKLDDILDPGGGVL